MMPLKHVVQISFLLFCAAGISSCCTAKQKQAPQLVRIGALKIGILTTGLPYAEFMQHADSLSFEHIIIEAAKTSQQKGIIKNQTLTLNTYNVEEIQFKGQAVNDTMVKGFQSTNPSVKKATLKGFSRCYPGLTVNNLVVGKIIVDSIRYSDVSGAAAGVDLGQAFGRTDRKIDSLKELYNRFIEDDMQAGAGLLDEINRIDEEFSRLKTARYRFEFESLEGYVDKIISYEEAIDGLRAVMEDSRNAPVAVNVHFPPGKYRPSHSDDLNALHTYIYSIFNDILTLYSQNSLSSIKVAVKLTGFSDDLSVGEELAAELNGMSNDPCSQQDQECLNKALSDARARYIGEYLEQQLHTMILEKEPYLQAMVSLDMQHQGKGWALPPEYQGNCTGDCSERRVTYISRVVYASSTPPDKPE